MVGFKRELPSILREKRAEGDLYRFREAETPVKEHSTWKIWEPREIPSEVKIWKLWKELAQDDTPDIRKIEIWNELSDLYERMKEDRKIPEKPEEMEVPFDTSSIIPEMDNRLGDEKPR